MRADHGWMHLGTSYIGPRQAISPRLLRVPGSRVARLTHRKQAGFFLSSTPSRAAIGDRADARRRYELHVFGQHATRIPRRRRFPARAAPRQFHFANVELDEQLVGIDRDRIAFFDQVDVSAGISLGRNVADHDAPRAAGEASVGDEADRLAQALPDERRSRCRHLLHARAALGSFVADDDHIARLDLLGHDRLEAGRFGIEYARRSGDRGILEPGDLGYAAFRSEVAFQDRGVALRI